jgi:hypothetical protein
MASHLIMCHVTDHVTVCPLLTAVTLAAAAVTSSRFLAASLGSLISIDVVIVSVNELMANAAVTAAVAIVTFSVIELWNVLALTALLSLACAVAQCINHCCITDKRAFTTQ